MKYDFTSIIDRHGMDAAAIDEVGGWGIAPTKPKTDMILSPCGWRI